MNASSSSAPPGGSPLTLDDLERRARAVRDAPWGRVVLAGLPGIGLIQLGTVGMWLGMPTMAVMFLLDADQHRVICLVAAPQLRTQQSVTFSHAGRTLRWPCRVGQTAPHDLEGDVRLVWDALDANAAAFTSACMGDA